MRTTFSLLLLYSITAVGCGVNAKDRYDQALATYMHEQARLERAEAATIDDVLEDKVHDDYDEQLERVKRAKKYLDEAEAALPK